MLGKTWEIKRKLKIIGKGKKFKMAAIERLVEGST